MPDENTILNAASAATATPAGGNPGEQATAQGQGAAQGAQNTQQSAAEAQPTEPTAEQIAAALRPQRTPAEDAEYFKKQYDASSREGQRLDKLVKTLQKSLLDEQGIELVVDPTDKTFKGFKATEKYSPEAANLKFSYDDLTAKEKELFADDPQKAFETAANRLLERAKKAFTRIAPTVEKVVEPLTESRLLATHEFLAGRIDPITGEKLFDEYDKVKPFINHLVADPQLPQWLKDAVAAHPGEAIPYLYSHIKDVRQRLSKAAQKSQQAKEQKQNQGHQAAAVQPTGSGSAVIQDGSAEQQFISLIGQSRR